MRSSIRRRLTWNLSAGLLGLMMMVLPTTTYAQQVGVEVVEEVASNYVIYRYRVTNNSDRSLVALRIGFDYIHKVLELTTPPLGWTVNSGLPESSAEGPPGWEARVITQEESPFIYIEWSSEAGPQYDIAPGAITEFSIVLPDRANQYRTAHYDVLFTNSSHAYGRLTSRSDD